jgi:hypothetical protein
MIGWRAWKVWLGLAVVFVAGLVIGSALTVGAIQRNYRERMNPENWTPRTLAWMGAELKLRPDQESAVRPIVEKSMTEMRAMRDETEQHWRTIVGKLLTEVAPQLDEPQREHLREVVKQAAAEKQRSPFGSSVFGS